MPRTEKKRRKKKNRAARQKPPPPPPPPPFKFVPGEWDAMGWKARAVAYERERLGG